MLVGEEWREAEVKEKGRRTHGVVCRQVPLTKSRVETHMILGNAIKFPVLVVVVGLRVRQGGDGAPEKVLASSREQREGRASCRCLERCWRTESLSLWEIVAKQRMAGQFSISTRIIMTGCVLMVRARAPLVSKCGPRCVPF